MSLLRQTLRWLVRVTPAGPRRALGRAARLLGLKVQTSYERFGYIDKRAIIEDRALITIPKSSDVAEYAIIKTYEHPIVIGERSHVGPFCVIYGGSGITIGNDVMIGPAVTMHAGNHDYKQIDKPMRWAGALSSGPIIIEDDVWIGTNSVVTDGVTIAQGCVIGAGAVVTKSTEAYGIYAGVPARKIGTRKPGQETE